MASATRSGKHKAKTTELSKHVGFALAPFVPDVRQVVKKQQPVQQQQQQQAQEPVPVAQEAGSSRAKKRTAEKASSNIRKKRGMKIECNKFTIPVYSGAETAVQVKKLHVPGFEASTNIINAPEYMVVEGVTFSKATCTGKDFKRSYMNVNSVTIHNKRYHLGSYYPAETTFTIQMRGMHYYEKKFFMKLVNDLRAGDEVKLTGNILKPGSKGQMHLVAGIRRTERMGEKDFHVVTTNTKVQVCRYNYAGSRTPVVERDGDFYLMKDHSGIMYTPGTDLILDTGGDCRAVARSDLGHLDPDRSSVNSHVSDVSLSASDNEDFEDA